jgi:hypothetical protein
MSPFNLAYYYCLEKTMEHAITCFQKFALSEQLVEIEGKNEQRSTRTFTRDDIKNLSGVKISNTNPLMGMISGRMEVADKLINMPRNLWGEWCSVLEGQPLSNLYRGEVSKYDLIAMENDKMAQGVKVPVLATDDHAKHIQLHVAEISDPEIRLSGKNLQVYMDHIMEHYTLSKQTAPDLLFMSSTGQTPPKPPGAAAPPTLGGGAPPQGVGSELEQPTTSALMMAGNGQMNSEVAEPSADLLARQGANA